METIDLSKDLSKLKIQILNLLKEHSSGLSYSYLVRYFSEYNLEPSLLNTAIKHLRDGRKIESNSPGSEIIYTLV